MSFDRQLPFRIFALVAAFSLAIIAFTTSDAWASSGKFAGPAFNGSLVQECAYRNNYWIPNGAYGLDYLVGETTARYRDGGSSTECNTALNPGGGRLGAAVDMFAGDGSCHVSRDDYSGSKAVAAVAHEEDARCPSSGAYQGLVVNVYVWANGTMTSTSEWLYTTF